MFKKISLIIFILLVQIIPFITQNYANAEEKKITVNNGKENDQFGCSIDISGDYAIVGARLDNEKGNHAGAAYILKKNDEKWQIHQKITSKDGKQNYQFGDKIAISGNYAIIGEQANNDLASNAGAAYIYKNVSGSWNLIKKINADDYNQSYYFGCSVDIDGDYAIVGAYHDKSNSGSAYIFKNNGDKWTQTKKITASTRESSSRFGYSVAISGDKVVIGAPYKDRINYGQSYQRANWGCLYSFQKNNNDETWTQKSEFYYGQWSWLLGSNVKISNNNLISSFNSQPQLSIFSIHATNATLSYKTSISSNDLQSMSIDNEYIIQSYRTDYTLPGSSIVTIYKQNNSSWNTKYANLLPDDNYEGDKFGYAVAISGNDILIGATEQFNDSYIRTGAVYCYNLNEIKNINNDLFISGYVFDIDNKPVFNASVKLDDIGTYRTDINGYYKVKMYFGWTGKIKVTTWNNYKFTPEESLYQDVRVSLTGQNFYRKRFIISGYIKDTKGKPINGALIEFSNNGRSAITDSSGFYSHEIQNDWNGIGSVSKKGYKFTPPYIEYNEAINQNYYDQNYIGNQYTISGRIVDQKNNPLENVKIFFNDRFYTVSDEFGTYSIDIKSLESGKLKPVLPGFEFIPPDYNYKNIDSNKIDVAFTANEKLFEISGTVKDEHNLPLSNCKLYIDNSNLVETTDENGKYKFLVDYNFTGNINIEKQEYVFFPNQIPYTNVSKDYPEENYKAVINKYIVIGKVRNVKNNNALNNVIIRVKNGIDTVTDNYGNYKIELAYNSSIEIIPELEGYEFFPPSYTINNIDDTKFNKDFSAGKKKVIISGNILDSNGKGVNNVTIYFKADGGSATTNQSGYYINEVDYGWKGHTELYSNQDLKGFKPQSLEYTMGVKENELNEDYTAIESTEPFFIVSKEITYVDHNEGVVSFDFFIYPESLKVLVNPDQSWMTIELKNNSIEVNFTKNESKLERKGKINILATDARYCPKELFVYQYGKPDEIIDSINPQWEKDFHPENYQYFETITAIVQDESQNVFENENDFLGAFDVYGVCRGVSKIKETSHGKRFFINIWGRDIGEKIVFKYYDSVKKKINTSIKNPIEFKSLNNIGGIIQPHVLTISDHDVMFDLNMGWNWISFNVKNEDMSINSVFSSINNKCERIITNGFFSLMHEDRSWYGTLDNIIPGKMYMLKLNNYADFEYSGQKIKKTMQLEKGWNWTGFNNEVVLPLNLALEPIQENGKRIIGQKGFAQYLKGYGWCGSLEYIEPNIGYILLLETSCELIFSDSKNRKNNKVSKNAELKNNTINKDHILYNDLNNDFYQYEYFETITAKLTNYFNSENDILLAYINNECRGFASPINTPNGNLFFLQIWSNTNNQETIYLKYYDDKQKEIYSINESFIFESNINVGDISNPKKLEIFSVKENCLDDGKTTLNDVIILLQILTGVIK